jgi:hypothetical protein
MRVSLSDLPVNEVKSLIDLQHHVNVQHADIKLRDIDKGWTVAKVCTKSMKIPSGLINMNIDKIWGVKSHQRMTQVMLSLFLPMGRFM